MNRVIHAITPGDHYSPLTGSAIPTVVHGLAKASTRDRSAPTFEHAVLVARGTYQPRYDSARIIEFSDLPAPARADRIRDAALARLGMPRRAAASYFQPQADALAVEEPAFVLAHNAPILPWLLRDSPHRSVLYAHNHILRTMTRAESGRMLDTAAAIVCVSGSLADQTRQHLPRRLRDRVHVVPNGVDIEQFVPRTGARAVGPLRILYVGRMIPEKGVDVLLEACARLKPGDAEILIVGSLGFDPEAALTPYERRLRALAERVPVPVRFEPFQARAALPALLQEADIMVVPSRWSEPSGLTVGEGLATGLPMVASRVGGIPEVIGSAGILVAGGDAAALARAIQALVADEARRRQLSLAARRHAAAHDWSSSWSQLKSVLQDV